MTEGVSPIDQALLPAAVRNGGAQRRKDYEAALGFERTLVKQMTDAMSKAMGALGGDEDGGDAATQQLKQQLPDTLADAIMSGGGIGLAGQLDQLWHPNATSTSLSKTQADAAAKQGGGVTATDATTDGGAA